MDRLLDLLRDKSFRRGEIVLASGRRSDFFIDCKQTVLTAEGHFEVGRAMYEAALALSPAPVAVAGVALGGCSLASAVSLYSFLQQSPSLNAIYVRKQAKSHGTRSWLEGVSNLPERASLAVLEDVITTGQSTLLAVERIRAAGLEVSGVVTVVDREEGGREALESAGLHIVALYRRRDFLEA